MQSGGEEMSGTRKGRVQRTRGWKWSELVICMEAESQSRAGSGLGSESVRAGGFGSINEAPEPCKIHDILITYP